MANKGKRWTNEDDSKLVDYLNEYKTLLHPENANIKVPDYEKIANKLGRSEYAILLRVIDKILFKNYNDINVDFKDLSLNYNIPSNFLKERFELNNMNTDMVGKKWTHEDDEYLNKSIEEGINYLEIAKYLKRKPKGVMNRTINHIIYKKYKDGVDIQTLKDKYKLNYSLEYLIKIFNKIDKNTEIHTILKNKEKELNDQLKNYEIKIKIKLSN